MNDDAELYYQLACAIVLVAVEDYKEALQGHHVEWRTPQQVIRECEEFFQSDRFTILSDMDGVDIMNRVREQFNLKPKDIAEMDELTFKRLIKNKITKAQAIREICRHRHIDLMSGAEFDKEYFEYRKEKYAETDR